MGLKPTFTERLFAPVPVYEPIFTGAFHRALSSAVEVETGRVGGAEIRLHEYICVENEGVGVPVRLDAGTSGFDNIQIRVEGQAVNYSRQHIVAGRATFAVRDMDSKLNFYIRKAAIFILDQHALIVRGEADHYFHLPYTHGNGDAL